MKMVGLDTVTKTFTPNQWLYNNNNKNNNNNNNNIITTTT